MTNYKAYTQKDWNAEKFYFEDEEENEVIFKADTAEQAKEKAIDWIYETSLYNEAETAEWLENNPIYIEEV
ncbi:MAG: hypothetical protein IJ737_06475 [Ruminococcus sp.]|nr:hypothetical protein [Ruminococcus sp.]